MRRRAGQVYLYPFSFLYALFFCGPALVISPSVCHRLVNPVARPSGSITRTDTVGSTFVYWITVIPWGLLGFPSSDASSGSFVLPSSLSPWQQSLASFASPPGAPGEV